MATTRKTMTDELDRLVKEADAEAAAIAAFVEGALVSLFQGAKRGDGSLPLKVADVELETDDDGNFRDNFTVVTASGIRINVKVSPE